MKKKQLLHLFLTLAFVTAAFGQAVLNPNNLVGQIKFTDCGLMPGDPAYGDVLNPNQAIATHHLEARPAGSGNIAGQIAGFVTFAGSYTLTVPGDPDCAPPGIVYDVDSAVRLASGAEYHFARRQSGEVFDGTPSPGCGAPPVTLDFCECPTVVEVCFVDCNNAPYPLPSPGRIEGLVGGQPQASLVIPAGAICAKLLVRGGVNGYQIKTTATIGADPYLDQRVIVFDRTMNTVCGDVQSFTFQVGDCTGPGCGLGRIVGDIDMLGESELASTRVIAEAGPWGNFRWHLVPGAPSQGTFDLQRMVPSSSVTPDREYSVYGEMSFRTGHRYEWFQTPRSGNGVNGQVLVPCGGQLNPANRLNLGNRFVLDPGYVQGDIRLCGPQDAPVLGLPSYLRWIQRQASGTMQWDSAVKALGEYVVAPNATYTAYAGLARCSFEGVFGPPSDPDAFVGDYDLVLGGLGQEPSVWKANLLQLTFANTAPLPSEPYLNEFIEIEDLPVPPVTVNPGQITRNDLDYCFSEIILKLSTTAGQLHSPEVSGFSTSDGLACGNAPASYRADLRWAYGLPGPAAPAAAGQIALALPAGTYTLNPSARVISGGSESVTAFPTIQSYTIGCGVRAEITPEIQLSVTNWPDCVSTSSGLIAGVAHSLDNVISITYQIGTGPAVAIPNAGGLNPSFSAVVTPLAPCANSVVVKAQDANGKTSTVTLIINHDSTPPVLSGCQDITVPCDGTNAINVNYVVTASDNCPDPVNLVCSPPPGPFPLGTTLVTCAAEDRCHNASTCAFKVTVVPFRLNCPDDIHVECTGNQGAVVNYAIPGALNACCPPVTVSCTPPPGLFPIGVTPVECTAHDACAYTNTCAFNIVVTGHTPAPQGRWVKAGGGAAAQTANALAVDDAGASLVVGKFTGSATFVLANTSTVTLSSFGGDDLFLAKYDTSGNVLWVRQAGGAGDDEARGVAVDAQGNVFVAGVFQGPAQFSGQTLTGFGGRDAFLAKYDPQGNLLWAVEAGGTGADSGDGVATDAAGNCYLTGNFVASAALRSAVLNSPSLPISGAGLSDCFLAKYSAAGAPLWADTSSGNPGAYHASSRGVAVHAASGDAWMVGLFGGNAQFGAAALSASAGNENAFVARHGATQAGGWTWARQTVCANGNCGNHDGRAIGVDAAGNCYFTAYYNGDAALSGLPAVPGNAGGSGLYNYLLGKLDAAGAPVWLKNGPLAVNEDNEPRALAVDGPGNVWLTGFLKGAWLFAEAGRDVWLKKFDTAGNLLWSETGVGSAADRQNAGRGVALDAAGCVYVTGSFNDANLSFSGFGSGGTLTAPGGASEIFLAKYCPECSCVPAAIVTPPQNLIAYSGPSPSHPLVFTATASGSLPVFFEWKRHVGLSVQTLNPGGGAGVFGCYEVVNSGLSSTLKVNCVPGGASLDTAQYSVGVGNLWCGDQPVNSAKAWVAYLGPRLRIERRHIGVAIRFNAVPGTLYQFERATEVSGPWTRIIIPGLEDGEPVFEDTNAPPGRAFYRVVSPDGMLCSANVVGYVDLTLRSDPSGAHALGNLIANPLHGTNNHLNTILPLPAEYDGTIIRRWSVAAQSFAQPIQFVAGQGWTSPDTNENFTIAPGEAFFIFPSGPNPLPVRWVGEVMQGTLVHELPAGDSFVSSMVPTADTLTNIIIPGLEDGDMVTLFDAAAQAYKEPYTYVAGFGWSSTNPDDPGPQGPVIPVGTGLRLSRAGAPTVWTQTLNLNAQCACCTAPAILAQPQSQIVLPGSNATFTVVASGAPPLRYKWRHGGMAIPGATNDTLTVPHVGAADEGAYDVVVSNDSGVTNSAIAQLLCDEDCHITGTLGPVITVCPGDALPPLSGAVQVANHPSAQLRITHDAASTLVMPDLAFQITAPAASVGNYPEGTSFNVPYPSFGGSFAISGTVPLNTPAGATEIVTLEVLGTGGVLCSRTFQVVAARNDELKVTSVFRGPNCCWDFTVAPWCQTAPGNIVKIIAAVSGGVLQSASPLGGNPATVTLNSATWTDASGNPLSFPLALNLCFSCGNYAGISVTFTGYDAQNNPVAQLAQNLVVNNVACHDMVAPTFVHCPGPLTGFSSSFPLLSALLPNVTGLFTAADVGDNCSAFSQITLAQNPLPNTPVSGPGPHVITVTATDAAGNSSFCLVEFKVEYLAVKMELRGPVAVLSWWPHRIGEPKVLEEADTLDGPWHPVQGATNSPYSFDPSGPQRFFRLRIP